MRTDFRALLSFSHVTWGTKQTLSGHYNPAFPRFLALGNQLIHRAEGENERRMGRKRQQYTPAALCSLCLQDWKDVQENVRLERRSRKVLLIIHWWNFYQSLTKLFPITSLPKRKFSNSYSNRQKYTPGCALRKETFCLAFVQSTQQLLL